MRKTLQRLCLAAITTISACTNFTEEDIPLGLSVKANNTILSDSSDSFIVTVSSGSIWSIANLPSWIETNSIARSSSSTYEWDIVFAAERNAGYNREGTISFSSGTQTESVVVLQKGSKGAYVPVKSVSCSPNEITLYRGERFQLTYAIDPKDASDQSVDWESSTPSVATVSGGIVEALSAGATTITLTTRDGGEKAYCKVTVIIPVESVALNENSVTIREGETYTLIATVSPSDAEDKSVTWSSSNTSVASVSSSGVITAKTVGNATITVKTNDGAKTATCQVTVKSKAIPVTGISLNKTTLSLASGDSETLYATITPSNATDQTVSWTSSNTSVATVSSTGLVTAKTVGNATITATTTDGGKKATCSVTVTPIIVTGVTLNKYSLSMYENDSETLIATVSPSNATNKNVSWSSNNTSVATVSSYGQVQAKAAGKATITVTTEDGQIKATCAVTVAADPYGAVDLGLSVKWASFNYGASSITAPGGYYFYGDPTGNAVIHSFTPPNVNSISGTQYDIVRRNWGGNWRIPTRSEINELYSLCTWTSTTLNGVSVLKVTGPSGASIYLPFTGCAFPADGPIGTTQIYDGNNAYLMSDNSYSDSNGRFVYIYYFTSSGQRNSVSYRADFIKFPIRPVR